MPDKKTMERARKDKQEGKKARQDLEKGAEAKKPGTGKGDSAHRHRREKTTH